MAAAGGPLEQLVRDELRGPIGEIVQRVIRDLVAEMVTSPPQQPQEATNGAAASVDPPATKTCRGCHEAKPRDQFTKGHSRCRRCRNAYERERRPKPVPRPEPAAESDPSPMPSSVGASLAPTRRAVRPSRTGRWKKPSGRERAWTERRRELIEEARQNGVTTELRGGREFTVLHLPAQFAPPAMSP